ncbi:MAG TPA: hypothetical protein GX747_01575 [Tenericutes bacterium]|nr:hypothetical protein [Mycoplasmatota bacterium]
MALNKKIIKNEKKITLTKFLKIYYGINNPCTSLLRHKDIDAFCIEGIKKVPFESVDNDDIRRGNILLVTDRDNNIGAYIRPSYDYSNEKEEDVDNCTFTTEKLCNNLIPKKMRKKYKKKLTKEQLRSKRFSNEKEDRYIAKETDDMIRNYKKYY